MSTSCSPELVNVLYGKRDFADGNKLRIVPSRDYLGLSGWAQWYCKSCCKRVAEGTTHSRENNIISDAEVGVMSFGVEGLQGYTRKEYKQPLEAGKDKEFSPQRLQKEPASKYPDLA